MAAVSLSIDQQADPELAPRPTQDRLARAAVRLFAERGFAATGIRDLARELDVSSAALYHYVDRKEELLVRLMSACLDEYLRVGRLAVSTSSDPLVQLCRLVHVHVAGECTNPLTSLVTDRELRSLSGDDLEEVMRRRDAFDELYRDVLTAGAETGRFRLIDPAVTRLGLMEMCNSVANWYRPGGSRSLADVQDTCARLARRLVGADGRTKVPVDSSPTVIRLASEPM